MPLAEKVTNSPPVFHAHPVISLPGGSCVLDLQVDHIFFCHPVRAAIEFLDQLYQYGKAGKTTINELGEETFDEDVPVIEDF